ncbi:hypothetical protein ANN_07856 [Periplaneta americana]|uniref:Uncharacterized protein n=1 Tax=Periplaneta americana TaxID=6978 RepID=A0ABQ8T155_PERAM|nr:hypothetical protein ANN_07856 [Periplaneta americana]
MKERTGESLDEGKNGLIDCCTNERTDGESLDEGKNGLMDCWSDEKTDWSPIHWSMMYKFCKSSFQVKLPVKQKGKIVPVNGGDGRNLKFSNGIVKSVDQFKYLGSVLHQSGTCFKDVENRVIQARNAIKQLNGVLWNRVVRMETKKMILYVIVESILTSGGMRWTLTERQKDRVRSVEMDGLRRSLSISRLQRVRNGTILEKWNIQEDVIDRLECRRFQWFLHVQRMAEERWPKKVLNWSPPGRRKKGRPRLAWRGGVAEAMETRGLQNGSWDDQ